MTDVWDASRSRGRSDLTHHNQLARHSLTLDGSQTAETPQPAHQRCILGNEAGFTGRNVLGSTLWSFIGSGERVEALLFSWMCPGSLLPTRRADTMMCELGAVELVSPPVVPDGSHRRVCRKTPGSLWD